MHIVEIEGAIQNYAWGSHTAIAEFQGREASSKPEAELWLGTHPRGVARLLGGAEGMADLRAFVSGELPFLFKVLAAERPLSLQAHPSRAQAEAGFAQEERAGIPADALTRNYRDRNHKPELICAKTEFHALSGFRELEESLAIWESIGLRDEFPEAGERLASGDLEGAFRAIFELKKEQLRASIELVRGAAADETRLPISAESVAPWLVKLAESHPEDPGVLAALLLNHVRLEPGEAMYLPAGNLHAYLHGVGLELMASSDNVMRGGLTPKHVDVTELCRILHFAPLFPDILPGTLKSRGEGVRACFYQTTAAEFELSRVEVAGQGSYEMRGPALVLVEAGAVQLVAGPERLELARGRSAFVAEESVALLLGDGTVAIAALPRT